MTVGELIELLLKVDQSKLILISCEGGCVEDDQITIIDQESKVLLEIQ